MGDITKYQTNALQQASGGALCSVTDLLMDLDKKKDFAMILIKSGLIPQSYNTPEKVLVAIFKCQELNIPVLEGLSSIAVINNKPTMQGNLILALINRSGRCKKMTFDSQETYCTVTMARRDYELEHTETFTLDDAKAAGLLGKQIWKAYQKVMLKWRAVAACARTVFPELLSGMYLPEEIASIDGNVNITIDENENFTVLESVVPKVETPKEEAPKTETLKVEIPVNSEINYDKLDAIKAALSVDELLSIYNSIPNGEKAKYTSDLSIRKKFLVQQYKQAEEILRCIKMIDNGIDYIGQEHYLQQGIEELQVLDEKKNELYEALDKERRKYELQ